MSWWFREIFTFVKNTNWSQTTYFSIYVCLPHELLQYLKSSSNLQPTRKWFQTHSIIIIFHLTYEFGQFRQLVIISYCSQFLFQWYYEGVYIHKTSLYDEMVRYERNPDWLMTKIPPDLWNNRFQPWHQHPFRFFFNA